MPKRKHVSSTKISNKNLTELSNTHSKGPYYSTYNLSTLQLDSDKLPLATIEKEISNPLILQSRRLVNRTNGKSITEPKDPNRVEYIEWHDQLRWINPTTRATTYIGDPKGIPCASVSIIKNSILQSKSTHYKNATASLDQHFFGDVNSSKKHHSTMLFEADMTSDQYIASKYDKPQWFEILAVDLLKSFNGNGLFATRDIDPGVIIGSYTGKKFTSKSFFTFLDKNKDKSNAYSFGLNNSIIDAQEYGNFTRYINYSSGLDNVEFNKIIHNGQAIIIVKTLKKILNGQQILVNYNSYSDDLTGYFFLNPQDNNLSALQIYELHQQHYDCYKINASFNDLGITNKEYVYTTKIGIIILNNEILANTIPNNVPQDVLTLPILRADDNANILDFSKKDVFSPLMLACLKGQIANVDYLIKYGAFIDQQQHRSGNYPLSLALKGYHNNKERRSDYLKIIMMLISNRATLNIHDSNEESFLHLAIGLLSNNDFNAILEICSNNNSNILFDNLNSNNQDIVIYALSNKFFVKFKSLMIFYPDYISEAFSGSSKDLNISFLLDVFNQFDPSEKKQFKEIIQNYCTKNSYDYITIALSEQSRYKHPDYYCIAPRTGIKL